MAFWNKTEKRSTEEKPTIGGVEITPNNSFGEWLLMKKQ